MRNTSTFMSFYTFVVFCCKRQFNPSLPRCEHHFCFYCYRLHCCCVNAVQSCQNNPKSWQCYNNMTMTTTQGDILGLSYKGNCQLCSLILTKKNLSVCQTFETVICDVNDIHFVVSTTSYKHPSMAFYKSVLDCVCVCLCLLQRSLTCWWSLKREHRPLRHQFRTVS